MYPGRLLSLANKGWDWAPMLKHVGIWVKKKWGTCKKKKRITRAIVWILEQLKWRSKDQNSKKSKKVEDTRKSNNKGGEFKEIKANIEEEMNSKELHSGIKKL